MEFYRYVLLVINTEDAVCDQLSELPGWEYNSNVGNAKNLSFRLINKNENIQITFEKMKNGVYRSLNVLPYKSSSNNPCEPQEKDIHNDILFALCLCVKKKYVNNEVLCGIIPCENDGI